MFDVRQALGAASRVRPAAAATPRRALVVGGAGPLGAAVLSHLLGTQRFERVGALVERAMRPALRGFVPVHDLDDAVRDFAADTALVVFERSVAANGRDAAFVRPAPARLAALATRLHDTGARRLVVVAPHTPSLLPMALQQGLASMDEAAVAAIGFEQLVFMRMAQAPATESGLGAPRRLARWMLSQLHWMVPQREQPVRVDTVARAAAALATLLADAAPGTRVLPAAVLWQVAQERDAQAVLRRWLAPAVVA